MFRLATLFAILWALPAASTEILEFTGSYCGSCRQMEPIVADLIRRGMPIRQIDVRQFPEVAEKFGVQSIPCFVSVAGDQPIDRIVGPAEPGDLVAMYERALAATAPAPAPSPHATSPQSDPVQRALAATVRLKIVDARGQSYGTGTIIDVHDEEALVVTCGHIFRDSDGKGEILCDLFCNHPQPAVPGRLISYDLRRDVALVSVRPGMAVVPVPVGGGGCVTRENDPVFAIGCSRGQPPTINHNRVISVNRYHGPANLVVGGRPVDGRSGGGLFNQRGALIGVCNAADQEADEGLYAALGPVQAELDEAGLGFVYRRTRTEEATNPMSPADRVGGSAPISLAATEVSVPIVPASTLETSQEIIVILRDRHHPSDQGQAYVLDRPSGELLRALSSELARRGPHVPTGLTTGQPAP